MNIHTGLVYNHTGYDAPGYFQLAVIVEDKYKKTVENAVAGFGFNSLRTVKAMIPKFYGLIADNRPQKPAIYDVTGCFRSPAKCN